MVKEFSNKTSSRSSIIVLIVCGAIGIITCLASVIIGVIFILAGVILFVLLKQLASDVIVECNPDGFVVRRMSKRKGNTSEHYKWDQVTKTRYFERELKSSDDSTIKQYFEVETAGGVAFRLQKMKHFEDLIEIFNLSTSHLPYTWQVKKGALNKLTKTYVQLPRVQAAIEQ